MAGEVEFGKCDICKTEAPLQRKYYRYPVKCECCNSAESDHFEIVCYCKNCTPKPPYRIKLTLKPREE